MIMVIPMFAMCVVVMGMAVVMTVVMTMRVVVIMAVIRLSFYSALTFAATAYCTHRAPLLN
jgi:hypothetical protein